MKRPLPVSYPGVNAARSASLPEGRAGAGRDRALVRYRWMLLVIRHHQLLSSHRGPACSKLPRNKGEDQRQPFLEKAEAGSLPLRNI